MITKEIFTSKLKKASLLTGRLVEVEVANALFEELKNEEEKDFLYAMKDIAYNGDFINLSNILRYLNKHRSNRLEKEAIFQKKREEKEVKEFLEKENIPDEIKKFLRKIKT